MGNLLYEYVKQGGLVIQGLYSFYSGGSYTLLGNWNNYELDPIKEAPCCNLAYQYGEDSDSKLGMAGLHCEIVYVVQSPVENSSQMIEDNPLGCDR